MNAVDKMISNGWVFARISAQVFSLFKLREYLSEDFILARVCDESDENIMKILKRLVRDGYLKEANLDGKKIYGFLKGDDDAPSLSGKKVKPCGRRSYYKGDSKPIEKRDYVTNKPKTRNAVFNFIKENRGLTSSEIADALNLSYHNVASKCCKLVKMKMIYSPQQNEPRTVARHYFAINNEVENEY